MPKAFLFVEAHDVVMSRLGGKGDQRFPLASFPPAGIAIKSLIALLIQVASPLPSLCCSRSPAFFSYKSAFVPWYRLGGKWVNEQQILCFPRQFRVIRRQKGPLLDAPFCFQFRTSFALGRPYNTPSFNIRRFSGVAAKSRQSPLLKERVHVA